MRVIAVVKATADSKKRDFLTRGMIETMDRYTDELAKAGILRSGADHKPSIT